MERPNGSQIECLDNFMVEHDDFARNRVKGDHGSRTCSRLWQELTEKVNSKGPPVRTT